MASGHRSDTLVQSRPLEERREAEFSKARLAEPAWYHLRGEYDGNAAQSGVAKAAWYTGRQLEHTELPTRPTPLPSSEATGAWRGAGGLPPSWPFFQQTAAMRVLPAVHPPSYTTAWRKEEASEHQVAEQTANTQTDTRLDRRDTTNSAAREPSRFKHEDDGRDKASRPPAHSYNKQAIKEEENEKNEGGSDGIGQSTRRPLCECGRFDGPCLYRWNVLAGEVRFRCSICERVLGGNSSNSHLHMAKEHAVDNPCVVWLDKGKSTHRKHRSGEDSKEAAVRRSNTRSNGKSTCSPACWERLIEAVLRFYSFASRRPNEAIFDKATLPSHYCDIDTHTRGGTTPPSAKTVQGK